MAPVTDQSLRVRPQERVVSAIPTPFGDDGGLDRSAFLALLAELEPEVDSVLVAGTTGEFLALSDEERLALVGDALEVFGADRTIAHIGAADQRHVRRLVDATAEQGATRVALLTPYYVPLNQAALLRWFTEAAGHLAGRALYAYLFAERTGITTEAATVGAVLEVDGVAGIKVSGAGAARLKDVVAARRAGQSVWSGDDANLGGVLHAGGTGVVSGTSAAFPALFGRLRRASTEGPVPEELAREVREATVAAGSTLDLLHTALARRTGRPWRSRLPGPAADVKDLERLSAVLATSFTS